jgi:PRC-barrel domain
VAKESLPVNLTKEQVSSSPDIDTDKPVSRQQESELFTHYPWQNYWGGGLYAGGIWGITYPASTIDNPIVQEADTNDEPSDGDQHLRSTDKVVGYNIQATDGDIGHVKDFIMDDQTWQLLFFVVDTHNWFGGKKVLMPVSDIKEVQWDNSKVVIDIKMDAVKSSKLFNESEFVHMESNKL